MSSKAAPLDLSDRPVLGTPRVPPVVLLCHATVEFCGEYWLANSLEEYREVADRRVKHERSCEAVQELRKTAPQSMKYLKV